MHPSTYNRTRGATRAFATQTSLFNMMLRGPQVAYEPDDGTGGGGGETTAGGTEAGGTEAGAADDDALTGSGGEDDLGGKPKPSDADAKLLKDLMKHKAAAKKATDDLAAAKASLDAYAGVDPKKVADPLAKEAEAERKELEAKGEYDRIIAQINEQNTAALGVKDTELASSRTELAEARAQIEELTIGADFGNSKFISEKTILSPKKARTLYGAHVDRVEGESVVYDKPRGEAKRTPLVDGQGNPLSFEAGIEKLISGDEDFESISKSNLKAGSGSESKDHKVDDKKPDTNVKGTSRIAANLKNLPGMPGAAKK